jgi:hypothetical protein
MKSTKTAFPLFVLLLLFLQFSFAGNESQPSNSSTTDNIDFEYGDFSNWTGYIGYNFNNTQPLGIFDTSIVTCGNDYAIDECCYHTIVTNIMNSAYGEPIGTDYYSGELVCPPAMGNFTARLGGSMINKYWGACPDAWNAGSYSRGEILEYDIEVDSSNAIITYSSMVLLNTGGSGHLNHEQSFFKVDVFDGGGNLVIPEVLEYASSAGPPPGFLQSTYLANGTPVWYRPWSNININLSAYLGQTVTIRFTAAGSTIGDHFGYAYINVKSDPITGMYEIQDLNSVFFFPNPFTGETTLNFNFPLAADTKLFIYNALGKLILETKIKSQQTLIRPLTSEGIYFYQLSTEINTLARGKIIFVK